jgi:hypothetical protein
METDTDCWVCEMDIPQELFTGTFFEDVTSFRLLSASTGISYRITLSVPQNKVDQTKRCRLLLVLDGCMQFCTPAGTARIQGVTGIAVDSTPEHCTRIVAADNSGISGGNPRFAHGASACQRRSAVVAKRRQLYGSIARTHGRKGLIHGYTALQ